MVRRSDVASYDLAVILPFGYHPAAGVEVTFSLEAKLDHTLPADVLSLEILVAYDLRIDLVLAGSDRRDPGPVAYHVPVSEDVRIRRVIFIESLDVHQQHIGISDDRPREVPPPA